jgi:predicted transcriptional regulator of viral defense system
MQRLCLRFGLPERSESAAAEHVVDVDAVAAVRVAVSVGEVREAYALNKEDALQLLAALEDVQGRLDRLHAGLRQLLADMDAP